jgi:hypothetical protein
MNQEAKTKTSFLVKSSTLIYSYDRGQKGSMHIKSQRWHFVQEYFE